MIVNKHTNFSLQNEEVLQRVKEIRNILRRITRRKVTGLVTRCSGTAFENTLFTERQNKTIKRTIFRKVRTETILKIYNTLVLPTFLYGSENCTLTALQRRRIEVAEMKLLRPLAGYTLYDHETNDSVRCELQTECILDKTDEYRRNWLLQLQRMPLN